MLGFVLTFVFFFLVRFSSLIFSAQNEKRIVAKGAIQYGKLNSLLLAVAHVIFYFGALYEAYRRGTPFNDTYTYIGIALLTFANTILYIVIYKLRDLWTLKIYILPQHRIERSFLFRVFRHPNYYLSIAPELLGLAIFSHVWYTLLIGYPIYWIFLATRIVQEERVMKNVY